MYRLALLLLLCSALTATACGKNDTPSPEPTGAAATDEPATATNVSSAVGPTPGLEDPANLVFPDPDIQFVKGTLEHPEFALVSPTSLAFGPDGRLYVAQLNGQIWALTLSGGAIAEVDIIAPKEVLQDVLGIAFNPNDAPAPITLYASHTALFAKDGEPYAGTISKLVGPDFERLDIVTGLPVSTVEHGTNGIAFDASGALYIAQGGTTNAGIPSERHSRPETPVSSAILIAELQDPSFDGAILYNPPGEVSSTVDWAGGDVRVFASGFRNPYDLVVHSNGMMYATDNGPNVPDGARSLSCDSEGDDPFGEDELNLVIEGGYYGHPNRNRGRTDQRQCTYRAAADSSTESSAPIATLGFSNSANGLAEYVSDAFGGRMRGDLIYVEWARGRIWRVVLSDDGTGVLAISQLVQETLDMPLDVVVAADGTVFVAEMDGDRITFFAPVESGSPE